APTLTLPPDGTSDEGDTFTGPGRVNDPGTADTWTATVDYGDGTGTQPLTVNADGTFTLSHKYDDNGLYTVSLTATDDNGGSATGSFQMTVNNKAPVVLFINHLGDEVEGGRISAAPTVQEYSWADVLAGLSFHWEVTRNGVPYVSPTWPNYSQNWGNIE